MKRRTFLKNTALGSAGLALSPYILKGVPFKVVPTEEFVNNDNILIVFELFGGNDGFNTVIPINNPTYHNLRPNIGYRKEEAIEISPPSGDDFDGVYFNPALVTDVYNDGFRRLFHEQGKMAILEGVGYDNPNMSHFRSQDIFLTGINSSDPNESLLEGWLGRFILSQLPNYPVEIPDHPLAVCVDRSVSLLFKTMQGHMSIALNDPTEFANMGEGLNPLPEIPLSEGSSSFDDEFNFVHVIAQQSEMYSKAVFEAYEAGKDKVNDVYNGDVTSQKMKLISALIAGGLKSKIYYVKLSNFDSHAQQMNADKLTGQHPTLLREMSNAISSFLDDAQQQVWNNRVAGMTITEFGRRSEENGSRGTDHGAAGLQFVFAGDRLNINSATYGSAPNLDDLDDNGNQTYPTPHGSYNYDFRRTYADVLVNWFGATQEDVASVFSGVDYLPIGILNPNTSSVNNNYAFLNENSIKAYPNPSRGITKFSFELRTNSYIRIELFNIMGEPVKKVFRGYKQAGIHEFPIAMNSSGNYIVSLLVNGRRFTKNITVLR